MWQGCGAAIEIQGKVGDETEAISVPSELKEMAWEGVVQKLDHSYSSSSCIECAPGSFTVVCAANDDFAPPRDRRVDLLCASMLVASHAASVCQHKPSL